MNYSNQFNLKFINLSANYIQAYGQEYTEGAYADEDINERYNLHIIVPVLWSLIIIFGIIGNGLIIYIILRRRLYKNSCTNCYIINVAIADLCFTIICVPFTMSAYIYKEWIFGEFMCHFENLLMFSSVQVSCLTLTAMTIDRYTAILYPLKSLDFRTTKLAVLTNIFIWIASFILNTPYYLYYNQVSFNSTVDFSNNSLGKLSTKIHYCIAKFPSPNMEITLTIYTVLISYVLPLSTIIFCYARMIIKIIKNSKDQSLTEEYKFTSSANKTTAFRLSESINKDTTTRNGLERKFYDEKKDQTDTNSINSTMISRATSHSSYTRDSKVNQKIAARPIIPVSSNKKLNLETPGDKAKKQKTKLLFLIATVAITFATTWLPAHVIQIWKIVFNSTFPYSDTMYIIKVISHTLSYSNSLINPFIYVFIGAKFRNHIYLEFNRLFCFLCFYKKQSLSLTRTSLITRNNKASEFSLKIYESNNHETRRFISSTNRRITKM